jgi:hypothetical protein
MVRTSPIASPFSLVTTFKGDFCGCFQILYFVQCCFIRRASYSTVSEDARNLELNPGLLRLWHWQSDALTIRLDLFLNPARSPPPHWKKISIYMFREKKLRGLSPNFHIMCLWAIYISHDRSTYFPAAEYADRSWEYINRRQKHDCGFAVPFLGIYVSNFRYSIFAVHTQPQ